jgi:hypothetical protein
MMFMLRYGADAVQEISAVLSSLGLYPRHVKKLRDEILDRANKVAAEPKIVVETTPWVQPTCPYCGETVFTGKKCSKARCRKARSREQQRQQPPQTQ